MPKLSDDKARRVEEASGGLLPDGLYVVMLRGVDGSGSGAKGPYWSWELSSVGRLEADGTVNGAFEGTNLWATTSLSDKADWKLKEAFTAFGGKTTDDTDDLCGRLAVAAVSHRVAQGGQREGQVVNQVDSLMPYDGDPWAAGGAGSEGGSATPGKNPDDDLFT